MNENKVFPLLKEQEFLIKLTEGTDCCMASPTALRLHGKLDFGKLERAIQSVIERNDALRMVVFKDESGSVYQRLVDKWQYKLDVRKISGATLDERVEKAVIESQRIMIERSYFDGKVAWDFVLFDLEDDEYILFNRVSHMLCDGVGNNIILAEIDALYRGLDLPAKENGFMDYYMEKQAPEYVTKMEEQIARWKNKTIGYKEFINIPQTGKMPTALTPFMTLPAEPLKRFAREHKDSVYKVNLFLIHASLSAAYGAADSVINCMDGSRSRKFSQTVGFLTNGYLSRVVFDSTIHMRDAFTIFAKEHNYNAKEARISFLLSEPYPVYVTYQNHYNFGNVDFCGTVGEPIPRIAELNSWNLLVFCVFESDESIIYLTGCDYDTFTPEVMNKIRKGFELGSQCLAGEDMTYAEYCKAIESV